MNKTIIILLKTIIQSCQAMIESMTKTSKSSRFKSLAPTVEIDNPKIYHEALDWALSNRKREDIKNIAITGYYGSGKSSVIKNFIAHYNHKFNFLSLSLATFKDFDTTGDSRDTIKEIEESILQQIFYNVRDSKIPNSRFSKIPQDLTFQYLLFAIPIIFFLLSISLFFFKEVNTSLEWQLTDKQISNSLVISGVSVILLILWRLKSLTLNKLSVKNLEVDLAKKNDDLSVLNKYIDEIIYFFKKTKYQVVIIEDIDRFETTEIFTKLREINLILNNSEITKDLHIVFIYAIKDDQFKNKKDRTKFFDFILPIIPVINLNNSIDKLLRIKNDNHIEVSNTLINELAIYIDDMRLLLNIFNEFLIYDSKIPDVSRDKILAVIIYKNLLPDDFALLAQNQGLLYALFEKKVEIIAEKVKELEKEIFEFKNEIGIIEKHILVDVKELRSIYLLQFIESLESNSNLSFRSFYLGQQNLSMEEMKSDENFEALNHNRIKYIFQNNGARDFPIKFEEVEKKVNRSWNYKEREALISDRSNNKISINKSKISALQTKISEVNKSNLSEIITDGIIENTLTNYLKSIAHKEIEQRELDKKLNQKGGLLKSLVTNGFIDEDYFTYISIFYEERITRSDFKFIQDVKNSKTLDFDLKLNKTANIIGFLNPRNLESKYAYNKDLTDFLLVQKDSQPEKDLLFNSIAKCEEPALNFIAYFISNSTNKKIFIQEISHRNTSLWDDFQAFSTRTEDQEVLLYELLLKYADLPVLRVMIEKSHFDAQIISDENFLNRIENQDKLQKILQESGIKLANINFPETNQEMLDFIYDHNHYSFTQPMLMGLYENRTKSKRENFLNCPYSIISKDPHLSKMHQYIQDNLDEYVSSIALKTEQNEVEDEVYYLILLNAASITFDNKVSLIQKQITKITKVSEVENVDLVKLLFKEQKLEPSWINLDYFVYKFSESKTPKELPELIINYLNIREVAEVLGKQTLTEENLLIENLEFLLINSSKINNERYDLLIRKFQQYEDLDLENIEEDKIKLLIAQGLLLLSEDNLNELRKEAPSLVIVLLEKFSLTFLNGPNEYKINIKELKQVLSTSKFRSSEKAELLKYQEPTNFVNDLQLFQIIASLLIDEKEFYVPTEIIFLLLDVQLKIDRSIKLFNRISGKLSKEQMQSYLSNMKSPFKELADSSSRPSIPKDRETTILLETLEREGIISSKKSDGKKYRIYKHGK